MALSELERAVLLVDRPSRGLCKGDVGVVVHVYPDTWGYEVEFFDADGETLALETLESHEVAPWSGRQILHARPLTAA